MEIFLTSVDRDGTGKGYDLELVKYLKKIQNSLILVGGASNLDDITKLLKKFKNINGLGIGSALHYDTILRKRLEYEDFGNTEFLKHNIHIPKNLTTFNLKKIKSHLDKNRFNIRL